MSCDIDAILIGIKAAGGQDSLTVESTCPKKDCDTTEDYAINLQNLLRSIKSGDYETPYKVGELEIYFKPIDYKVMNEISLEQFNIQAKYSRLVEMENNAERIKANQEALRDITEITMNVLTAAIDKIGSPDGDVKEKEHIVDFLKNCDTKTYEGIRDHNGELRAESTIRSLDMKCATCGHEYTQGFTLNATDFFA